MKYIIFFMLSFVAVQASPRYDISISRTGLYENDWDQIWNNTQTFIPVARRAFDEHFKNMNDSIDNVKQEIKEIIEVGSISDIRDKIIDSLKNMLGHVNPQVQACINKQNDKITQLATDTDAALQKCASVAQDNLLMAEDVAKDILNAASKLLSDASKAADKCIESPITAKDCLTDNLYKLVPNCNLVTHRIFDVTDVINSIFADTEICTNQVKNDTSDNIKIFYNDIIACAAN